MTNNDATSAIAVIPQQPATGHRFDDEIRRLAFQIWLWLAHRNCAETHRKLAEELRRDEENQDVPVPSVRQIQYWAKKYEWDKEGNRIIREAAPDLVDSQLSRLFTLTDLALDRATEIVEGRFLNHEKTGNVAIMNDMVKHLLNLRGLGTAGAVGAPQLEVKVNVKNDQDDLPAEKQLLNYRDSILKRKQMRKLTGANPRVGPKK